MSQENKDLLLKDLCARLPYGIICKVYHKYRHYDMKLSGVFDNEAYFTDDNGSLYIDYENIKPYLFPLSSMTEEQKNELEDMEWSFDNYTVCNILECFGQYSAYVDHSCCFELIDWFHKNHIDYRGLIPMGLANDATGLNIY